MPTVSPGGGPPPFFMFFFILIAILIVGVILVGAGSGIAQWSRNNDSPEQRLAAHVVAKRTEVWGGSGDSSASTRYYATFQFEDGSRLELPIKGSDYGLLAEDDHGILHHQGTRFFSFTRNI